jgi:AraC-like DNA-binding protein/ligand-binding sensor protein
VVSTINSAPPWVADVLQHPLIKQIVTLISDLTEMRIVVVYPTETGWGQRAEGPRSAKKSSFCKMVQSTKEGAQQCRMCHVLMAVSACSGAPTAQRCHAGASVLVVPATKQGDEPVAVVSSCLFSEPKAWESARVHLSSLGLDMDGLHKSFSQLPELDPGQLKLSKQLLSALGDAIHTIRENVVLRTRRESVPAPLSQIDSIPDLLANTRPLEDLPTDAGPRLIRVVCDLVRRRPNLPLSVKALSAAAGLSPNHFSALFSQSTGYRFTQYLAEARVDLAKQLLADATIHVNEVARRSGFEDAGYFSRRFRQLTGVTPGAWRNERVGA